jgi:hypothetical protein
MPTKGSIQLINLIIFMPEVQNNPSLTAKITYASLSTRDRREPYC